MVIVLGTNKRKKESEGANTKQNLKHILEISFPTWIKLPTRCVKMAQLSTSLAGTQSGPVHGVYVYILVQRCSNQWFSFNTCYGNVFLCHFHFVELPAIYPWNVPIWLHNKCTQLSLCPHAKPTFWKTPVRVIMSRSCCQYPHVDSESFCIFDMWWQNVLCLHEAHGCVDGRDERSTDWVSDYSVTFSCSYYKCIFC